MKKTDTQTHNTACAVGVTKNKIISWHGSEILCHKVSLRGPAASSEVHFSLSSWCSHHNPRPVAMRDEEGCRLRRRSSVGGCMR